MKDLKVNNLILALFLLCVSPHAFSIGGDVFKNAVLVSGFFLLFNSVNFFKKLKMLQFTSFFSILYFLLFVLISLLLQQETSTAFYITFDFICLCFFLAGYYLSQFHFQRLNISNYVKVFIFLFSFIGSLYLIDLLIAKRDVGIHTRNLEDAFLNVNGIAFVCSKLIILIIWLFLIEKEKKYKFLFLLSLFSIFTTLILTQSRGASLFLIVTLIICYRSNIIKLINRNNLLYSLLFCIFSYYLIDFFPQILERIQLFSERFNDFFVFDSSNVKDLSIINRQDKFVFFFNNINDMIFGQKFYKPYPHNQFLEIFMRWGIFGFPILFISILTFLRSLKNINKLNSKTNLIFLISTLFIFTYLQSMTSLSLDNNRFLWLGFGFFLSKRNQLSKVKKLNN